MLALSRPSIASKISMACQKCQNQTAPYQWWMETFIANCIISSFICNTCHIQVPFRNTLWFSMVIHSIGLEGWCNWPTQKELVFIFISRLKRFFKMLRLDSSWCPISTSLFISESQGTHLCPYPYALKPYHLQKKRDGERMREGKHYCFFFMFFKIESTSDCSFPKWTTNLT